MNERKIKFRAWDKDNSRMVDDFAISAGGELVEAGVSDDGDGRYDAWLKPSKENYEIMQYTGLKDKNGVEIYEGDILEVDNRKDCLGLQSRYFKGQVIFAQNWGRFGLRHPLNDNKVLFPRSKGWQNEKPLIIGNIYENPELLTEN